MKLSRADCGDTSHCRHDRSFSDLKTKLIFFSWVHESVRRNSEPAFIMCARCAFILTNCTDVLVLQFNISATEGKNTRERGLEGEQKSRSVSETFFGKRCLQGKMYVYLVFVHFFSREKIKSEKFFYIILNLLV